MSDKEKKTIELVNRLTNLTQLNLISWMPSECSCTDYKYSFWLKRTSCWVNIVDAEDCITSLRIYTDTPFKVLVHEFDTSEEDLRELLLAVKRQLFNIDDFLKMLKEECE